jgi:hypothetical protein
VSVASQSLYVLVAASALSACSPSPTPVYAAPPPKATPPAASARAPGDAGLAAATDAADATALDATPAQPPPIPVQVEIETPYKLYERPRYKGAVKAAGADEELARWNVGGLTDPDFISSRPGYHPGARVRVDTRVLAGRLPKHAPKSRRTGKSANVLSETSLLARSRKYGYWPFRLCFEEGLRQDQELHGETRIRMTVNRYGRVQAPRLARTKLEDKAVADCLVEATRKLDYPPPDRGRAAVELTVKLWPGDAPVPRIGPPKDKPADNPGELDAQAVALAVAKTEPDIADCYRAALARSDGLWGRVQVELSLDARGRVTEAHERESRLPDREGARCVVASVRKADFPAPKAGRLTLVIGVRLGKPPPPAQSDERK